MDLRQYWGNMYVWAIDLLLLVAILASYTLQILPTNLIAAIIVCAGLDVLLKKFYLKRPEIKFPFSAIVTGIIIGSIISFNASLVVILLASVVAILSKFFIRLKGMHIFNPAVTGLLVALAVFSLADEWWAAIGFNAFGIVLPVTFLLIFANHKAAKLKVALPFLAVIAVLYYFTGFVPISSFTVTGLLAFVNILPFYFAFIMLTEPKTSPYGTNQQIIFGVSLAVLLVAAEFGRVPYSFFVTLLIGNLGYSIYRNYFSSPRSPTINY